MNIKPGWMKQLRIEYDTIQSFESHPSILAGFSPTHYKSSKTVTGYHANGECMLRIVHLNSVGGFSANQQPI